MSYKILDTQSVLSFVKSIDIVKKQLAISGKTELTAQEIGDGNLNNVFLVSNKQKGSHVVVKQALPYLRSLGENYPLTRERINYEIDSMEIFNNNTNEHVPEIYYADKKQSLMIMEYLDGRKTMRKGLLAETVYLNFSDSITTFLAENMFKTSSFYLDRFEKQKLIKTFINNTELCDISEKFVFLYGFMPHETNVDLPQLQKEIKLLWEDSAFKKNVLQLKYIFMTKAEALIHGDLHTGSIMIGDDRVVVIDSEFAFMGPMAFDIGVLIAHLIFAWIYHFVSNSDINYQTWLLQQISLLINKFTEKFLILWDQNKHNHFVTKDFISQSGFTEYQNNFMGNIFQESIGFAGCELARRIPCPAGVEEIRDALPLKDRLRAEKMALKIGRMLVTRYQTIHTVDVLLEMLNQKGVKS